MVLVVKYFTFVQIYHDGQVEWEYSRQLARRRLEQEQGSREAAEELSVADGDTKDQRTDADGAQQPPLSVPRIGSEARIVSDDEDDAGKADDRNLYIVLIRYINRHVMRHCPTPRDHSWLDTTRFCTLYKMRIVSLRCSIHGLVRGENMELGRDSDTGGQVSLKFPSYTILPPSQNSYRPRGRAHACEIP